MYHFNCSWRRFHPMVRSDCTNVTLWTDQNCAGDPVKALQVTPSRSPTLVFLLGVRRRLQWARSNPYLKTRLGKSARWAGRGGSGAGEPEKEAVRQAREGGRLKGLVFGSVQEFHNFSSSHPLRGERGSGVDLWHSCCCCCCCCGCRCCCCGCRC